MPEHTYVVGDPAMRPEPMEHHGPGWTIDVHDQDGETIVCYQLWAPRTAEEARQRGHLSGQLARDHWAASWHLNSGRDCDFARADSPSTALAVFTTYWQGILDQRAAAGDFVAWSREDFVKGDEVAVLGRWLPVRRVNTKSVSVPGAFGYAMSGNDASWSETVPWDKIHGRRRDGWQLDRPNGQPWPVELAETVARWRDLLGQADRAQGRYDHKSTILRITVAEARRNVHGLPADAPDHQVEQAENQIRAQGVDAVRALAARYVQEYDRLNERKEAR